MESLFESSLGLEAVIMNHNKRGMDSFSSQKYESALQHLHQANLILQQKPNAKLQAMTLNNLGCLYKRLKQYSKALTFLNEALLFDTSDHISRAATYLNICAVKSLLAQHQEALWYAQKALGLLRERQQTMNGKMTVVIAYNNAANEMEFLGQLVDAALTYYEGWQYSVQHLGRAHELSISMLEACKTVKNKRRNIPKQELNHSSRTFISHIPSADESVVKSLPHVKKPINLSRKTKRSSRLSPVVYDSRIHFIGEQIGELGKRMKNFEESFLSTGRKRRTPDEISFFSQHRQEAAKKIQRFRRKIMDYRNVVKACSLIQKCFKMTYSKQYAQQLKRSVILFQSSFKAKLACLKVKQEVNCRNIQAYYKMWTFRILVNRNKHSRTIQIVFRCYFYREIIGNMRQKMINIQSVLRRGIDKDKFAKIKAKSLASSVFIQKIYRGWQGRKVNENYKNQLDKSSLFIQNMIRNMIHKNRYKQVHQELTGAQKVIDKWYKGWKCRREFKKFKNKVNQSCLTIQCKFRNFIQRLSVQLVLEYNRKIHRSACLVQRKFRSFIAQNKANLLKIQREKINKSTLEIQAKFKQYIITQSVQLLLTNKRLRDNNRLKIQVMLSDAFILKKHQFLLEVKKEVQNKVVIIQSFTRFFLTKLLVSTEKKRKKHNDRCLYVLISSMRDFFKHRENESSLLIQKLVKSRLAKDSYRNELKKKKWAIFLIQRHYLLYKSQKLYRTDFSRFKKSFSIFNSVYIRRLMSNIKKKTQPKLETTIRSMLDSIVMIQSVFRRFKTQVHFLNKKYLNTYSAVHIQKHARGYYTKKTYLKLKRSAIKIQSFYRSYRARKQYQILKSFLNIPNHKPTNYPKANLHYTNANLQNYPKTDREIKTNTDKMVKGIILVQRWARSLLDRIRHKRKVREESLISLEDGSHKITIESFTIIQLFVRTAIAKMKRFYMKSIVKTQSHVRGFLRRQKTIKMTKAAFVLQRSVKQYFLHKRLKQQQSAKKIQRAYRAFRSKKLYQNLLIQNIKMIQACFRGFVIKQFFKSTLPESIKRIKAFFRGFTTRKYYKTQMRNLINFQSALRTFIIKKEISCKIANRKVCICIKQFVVKKAVMRERAASRIYRKFKTFLTIIQCRNAINSRKIQSVFRRYLTIINVPASFYEKNKTEIDTKINHFSSKVNSIHYSESLESLPYFSIEYPAIKIQSFFRGIRIRIMYLRVLKATRTIQRYFRARKVRKVFLDIKSVVVFLQCYWRMRKNKNRFRSLREPVFTSRKNWY